MTQIKHDPPIQAFLDSLASTFQIDGPCGDQSLRHPSCPHVAGTIPCLNAAMWICEVCPWWIKLCEPKEEGDGR